MIEEGLAIASRGGADGCIVLVDESSHADVRFALNTTTTNGVRRDRSVTVVAIKAGAVGVARRSGVVDVEQMVSAALTDAEGAPPADDAFVLVDGMGAASGGEGGGGGARAASLAFGRAPVETDLSALGGVLSGLSGAFGRARDRDVVLAGFAEFGISTLYLGSSTGVRLSFSQPTGAVNLVGRSSDGARSAWTGAGAERIGELSFESMETELWRRLEWARRPLALDAGRYEVILPPAGVADLMGSLAFYGLSGLDAEDGRTVFSADGGADPSGDRASGSVGDRASGRMGERAGERAGDPAANGRTRVGEQISEVPFTLYSDPFEPGLECLPFVACGSSSGDSSVFDNGLPMRRVDWIRDGRLAHLRYHRAGAARSGVEMAPYIDNLILRAGPGPGPGDGGEGEGEGGGGGGGAAGRLMTWWPAPSVASC